MPVNSPPAFRPVFRRQTAQFARACLVSWGSRSRQQNQSPFFFGTSREIQNHRADRPRPVNWISPLLSDQGSPSLKSPFRHPPGRFQSADPGPVGFQLDQCGAQTGAAMAHGTQQLIAGHGAAKLRACQAAAGNDQLITVQGFAAGLKSEACGFPPDFLNLTTGFQGDIGLFQCKPQHIHHGIGLIRKRIDPPGGFRHSQQPQFPKPVKGAPRTAQGIAGKGRVISMVATLGGMEIGRIAPAVAGCLELSAHPGLPLQQDHPACRILRRPERRRHTGSTAANNTNDHISLLIFSSFVSGYYIDDFAPRYKKNFFPVGRIYAIMEEGDAMETQRIEKKTRTGFCLPGLGQK